MGSGASPLSTIRQSPRLRNERLLLRLPCNFERPPIGLPNDMNMDNPKAGRVLCAGLATAHEQGVLHRDLKPANVMIDGRGKARIMDFGLAGLAGEFRGHEVRAGTPAYMAPEQLAGKEVTVRSDIYSLGLVLYEIFTGRKAFEASSLEELMRLHE